jgi:cytochrome P450
VSAFIRSWRFAPSLTQTNARSTGNSAPAVYWAVLKVLARPDLVTRVRDIALSAHGARGQESESTKLGNNPLLQSIFAEVTRLRVVAMIARLITGGKFQLDRWSIPEGPIVGLPSRTGALNKDIWNAGTEEDPHPLEDFWEERFLLYDDKPSSEPLREQETEFCSSKQQPVECSLTPGKTPSEPTFSLRGLKCVYTSFSGGPAPCPGRQFAKLEVTSTLAKLVLDYDVELQVPKGWEPKMDTSFFPLGTLPPKDKVPFRIRRRLP